MIAAVQTKGYRRGKSGLHRAGCRITSGGGDSKASATEKKQPCSFTQVILQRSRKAALAVLREQSCDKAAKRL